MNSLKLYSFLRGMTSGLEVDLCCPPFSFVYIFDIDFFPKALGLGVEKEFQLPVPLNASKSVSCHILHTELVRF